MSALSGGAASQAAIARVAAVREELGAEDFAAWAFMALGLLGWQAPQVLDFIVDRVDDQLAKSQAAP